MNKAQWIGNELFKDSKCNRARGTMGLLLVYVISCLCSYSHFHSDCVCGCPRALHQECPNHHSGLANILAASLTTIAGTAVDFLNRAILSSVNNLCSSDTVCRVYYWLISTGGMTRLRFMATFAMVVFIIIRSSNAAVCPIILFLLVMAIWIFVIAFNVQVFSNCCHQLP